jgi:hypothetical protein
VQSAHDAAARWSAQAACWSTRCDPAPHPHVYLEVLYQPRDARFLPAPDWHPPAAAHGCCPSRWCRCGTGRWSIRARPAWPRGPNAWRSTPTICRRGRDRIPACDSPAIVRRETAWSPPRAVARPAAGAVPRAAVEPAAVCATPAGFDGDCCWSTTPTPSPRAAQD